MYLVFRTGTEQEVVCIAPLTERRGTIRLPVSYLVIPPGETLTASVNVERDIVHKRSPSIRTLVPRFPGILTNV